tara:strand:+ start:39216 stop:40655 length:1440 start_codon:yes stop_codon:yes gene_type:complete
MQAFRQSQGKTSADDFNNLSIPKPHGMGDQPSSKQNDLKDDPDEVLKGLMVHPDYHAEGETGDRLRKAVTDGFKLAYPGEYKPGSFGKDDKPAVRAADLRALFQDRLGTKTPLPGSTPDLSDAFIRGGSGTPTPTAGDRNKLFTPKALNDKPAHPSPLLGLVTKALGVSPAQAATFDQTTPIRAQVEKLAVENNEGISDERKEAPFVQYAHTNKIPKDANGQPAFLWSAPFGWVRNPSCQLDPNQTLPPIMPPFPAIPPAGLDAPETYPDSSRAHDDQNPSDSGRPDQSDVLGPNNPSPFPDQSDEVPQITLLPSKPLPGTYVKPGGAGGHIIHGGRTPFAKGFRGFDVDREGMTQEPNISLTEGQRRAYDNYLKGEGGRLMEERKIRENLKIAPSQSFLWTQIKKNPMKDGKYTNGLKGKNYRYYDWDYSHSEIEVYNKSGRHLGAIDGVTGEWTSKPDLKKGSELEPETGQTTSGSA